MTTADQQISDLFSLVQKKKEEISSAERPAWKTNGSFCYSDKSSDTNRVAIFVCSDPDQLTKILAFLITQKEAYSKASAITGIKTKFSWCGHSYQDWEYDIKTRVSNLSLASKRKELAALEERLNAIVSPEVRRQMELEAISKALLSE